MPNYEELEKLSDLKEKGIISEDEFAKKKKEILDENQSSNQEIHQKNNLMNKLKQELNNSKVQEIKRNNDGNVVVIGDLYKYICKEDGNDINVKQKWVNSNATIIYRILAVLSGIGIFINWFFLITTIVLVATTFIKQGSLKSDVKDIVSNYKIQ